MADALFVVLRKLALSLGEGALEKIGTEVVEAASISIDFEHSIKQIEGNLVILQAFITQVGPHKISDEAFDAWLDQVRDVAHEVEDIIDEYAYRTAQTVDTSSFFKRKFNEIKNFSAWQKFSNQISQIEARIQRLAEMRNRYGISVGELDMRDKSQHLNQLFMSESAYLTDNSEIVGNADEIERLTQWLLEEIPDRTLIAILEGLVEERDGTTMEEVAEYYLAELTQRSLLQVTERSACGRARAFLMHDLVRDVTLNIAKKEKFGISYGNTSVTQLTNEARRLSIQRGWFPKLRSLQLADMEHLNHIEIEDGTMMRLQTLELTGLRNLKIVPDGIKYIRTLHLMVLADMSNEFRERMLGSDNHIVQHIPNIHNFDSSDSQAVDNFMLVRYLARKLGPGAIKYAPTKQA
ncbi:hypothetical protein PR202_gb28331 [Eleusine coracana subsp. coracana]|uniref:Rx N-terminal domain-containing protein n=1 Tax=Eleusine coracana subsp. coracana TaxID=191504 RepID=A0AAV5FYL0_ELECO|nr:hypothetical protein PR202_gb28331 [Eleusine coracana subsp. coracana]